jgi:hypothetical protein
MSIPILATVALLEDLPDHQLRRGEIGTVVEELDKTSGHVLVEFADNNGQTYAMEALLPSQLILLHRRNHAA